jgi:hypothetical protein
MCRPDEPQGQNPASAENQKCADGDDKSLPALASCALYGAARIGLVHFGALMMFGPLAQ